MRGSPILGSGRRLRRSPLETYRRAMLAHGPVARFRIGPRRVGVEFDAIFDPAGARQVLATDARRYRKDAPVFREVVAFLGDGILTSDGDRWRRDRKIVQPLFTRKRVAEDVDRVAGAAAGLVASWEAAARAGGEVDLNEGSVRFALDALGRAVFGEDLDRLRPVLRGALPQLTEHALRRGLSPVRLPRSWPTPAARRAARAQATLYRVVDELIAARRAGGAEGDDLLSLLLRARDADTGAALDDRNVRDQALVFLLGGHETTASAFASTLQLLARNPEAQERVRTEAGRELGGALDPDVVDRLRFTTQVVREALRLYPPAHTLVRAAVEATSVLGHAVPRDHIVAVSIWGIHHNPAVWDRPDRFDPDRFDRDGEDGPHEVRYDFLPFGGGPRGCIGERLAMLELVVGVAAVVRAFRFGAVVAEPELEVGLTMRPRGALPCRLEPAPGNGDR